LGPACLQGVKIFLSKQNTGKADHRLCRFLNHQIFSTTICPFESSRAVAEFQASSQKIDLFDHLERAKKSSSFAVWGSAFGKVGSQVEGDQ
jgi:hypothetical protein